MPSAPLTPPFSELGAADLPRVGGKGANLGELTAAGFPVPPGFCLTTDAWRRFVRDADRLPALLGELAALDPEDLPGVQHVGGALRAYLLEQPVPAEIREQAIAAWRELGGETHPVAVRSSATAEDLPTASFAGQQDTYLNIHGEEALLAAVRACWVSLFTDRAIHYRRQNDIPHDQVALSVVVQRMVRADRSGILFTADPVSGHRGHAVVDAGFGLGEALVSGVVTADYYRVDRATGATLERRVGQQAQAIRAEADGGTSAQQLHDDERGQAVLSERQLRELVTLGDSIEAHYGSPQDLEWCFEGEKLWVVQSRPITSLYPLMQPRPEGGVFEVALSFGHPQMITDAMKPLARSVIHHLMPLGRRMVEDRPSPWMREAGSRIYIDISRALRFAPARRMAMTFLPIADALIAGAIRQVAERPGFMDGPRMGLTQVVPFMSFMGRNVFAWLWLRDVSDRAARMATWSDGQLADMKTLVENEPTPAARIAMCRGLLTRFFTRAKVFLPQVAGGVASRALLMRLTGDADRVNAIGRGLLGNVTTDMDQALGDIGDVARAHPAVRQTLLDGAVDLDALAGVDGADAFAAAMGDYLERYGMRGPGEFDLTRDRWRDDPSALFTTLRGNLKHDEAPGAHRAHFAQLAQAAEEAGRELVARTKNPIKRRMVARLVRVHRELMAVREHPKYLIVRFLDLLRTEARRAGRDLVVEGRLGRADDVWFLRIDELIAALEDPQHRPAALVAERREEFERHRALTPPRVLTSDGEAPRPPVDKDLPPGTLGGSPVSAGVVVGVARVITDPTTQVLHKGEILVAPFTDPGWTPLFLNAAGVVLEVGGVMTHGSVVAREYGIPAVVCVLHATTTIRSGQRIEVDGDQGRVRILDEGEPPKRDTGHTDESRS